jgi:hypothetical protein
VPCIISTTDPHYFIVVGIDGEDVFLVKCTSQGKKKEEYFERAGLDLIGLVCIKPDQTNGLEVDTFINCNDPYNCTRVDLILKATSNMLEYKGVVSFSHYDQIRTGIINSATNDTPHFLLVHPDD